ncbi:hypothetical protein [Pseudomonas fontis]|uniref:Uncharacterized protein n=1 Tax=Pseudomonas fontis TaxID=2942633 RepID=A0ABT5NVR0_9PSED|nr:hypothetical protein [Pseudomonas fontis]MDD0975312.1 hypothetical protein [Pseudomonas fontis]MDD0992282.1 hypothetical protein [Pseudomonas fontis]
MQLNTALLMATPCDDEEDNMATLCFHSEKGHMFVMTRYPDEDRVDITLDDEYAPVENLKVTLSASRLLVEVTPQDADVFGGDDHLEITLTSTGTDLAEVEETLQNILKGTGTYVSEL